MKLAIITGVSRGLGMAFWNLLVAKPAWSILCIGRSFSAEQIHLSNQHPDKYFLLKVDLAQADFDVDAVKVLLSKNWRELLYINNAATIEPIAPLQEVATAHLQTSFQINVLSSIRLLQEFVHAAKKIAVPARVLNISSGAAKKPIKGWGAYCISKAAMEMYINVLQLDLTAHANFLKIENVDPGLMDTEMQRTIRSKTVDDFAAVDQYIHAHQSGRLVAPEVVAANTLEQHGVV